MAAGKHSYAQQARLGFLQSLPPRLERIHRQIEELATHRLDESQVRNLARLLESLKHEAQGIGLNSLADALGVMTMLARRTGGLQMRIRGLREGLASLRINYEGALREITRPQDTDPEPEAP